jgi:hypothetical protein
VIIAGVLELHHQNLLNILNKEDMISMTLKPMVKYVCIKTLSFHAFYASFQGNSHYISLIYLTLFFFFFFLTWWQMLKDAGFDEVIAEDRTEQVCVDRSVFLSC